MNKRRVTFLGGGNSSKTTHPWQGYFHVTVGNTPADSGGDTGRIVRQYDNEIPPMGDPRRASVNGVPSGRRELVRRLFEHSLNGCGGQHKVGNIIIAALWELNQRDFNLAMEDLMRFLNVPDWDVWVAAEKPVTLMAELRNGTILTGEGEIDKDVLRGGRSNPETEITKVWIEPNGATANPRLVEAIHRADLIVMGPTDHVTSLLPILLVPGISEALRETKATRVYVANLMTKPNETNGYQLADYINDIHRYAGDILDHVLVNTVDSIPPAVRKAYAAKQQFMVHVHGDEDFKDRPKIVQADLVLHDESSGLLRHNPLTTMDAILRFRPELRNYM